MRRISRPIGVFFGERRGRPLPTVPPSSFRIRTSERLLPAATTASLRSADRFFAVVVRRPASGRDGTRQLPPAGSLGISTSSDVLRFSADICVSLLFYQASFTRYGSFLFSLFRFFGGALCVRQPVRQVWRWRRGCYLHHRVCCFLCFFCPPAPSRCTRNPCFGICFSRYSCSLIGFVFLEPLVPSRSCRLSPGAPVARPVAVLLFKTRRQ